MGNFRIVAIGLIVAGVLALIYGGFMYPKHHDVDLGVVDVKYDTDENVDIPLWAGAAAVGVGTVLLVTNRRP